MATLQSYLRPGAEITNVAAGDISATDIQGAINELDTEKVGKALFDANTILAANADDTPLALTVDTNTVVGRAAGSIEDIAVAANSLVGRFGADLTSFSPALNSVIGKAAGNLTDLSVADNQFFGRGGTNLGGISVAASQFVGRDASSNLKGLSKAESQAVLSVDDLITLSGVADGAINLGTFTGAIIPDSSTVKAALQALETDAELHANQADVILKDGSVAFTGNQSMGSNKITNLLDPTADQDAATKKYVDDTAAGIVSKAACQVATTGAITLSGEQTIDGVLTSTSRVLVKNQGDATQNGIYDTAAGAWTRSTDFDGSPASEVAGGALTFVTEGTANINTSFRLTGTGNKSLGVDTLDWVTYSRAEATTASQGVTKVGLDFRLDSSAAGDGLGFAAGVLSVNVSAGLEIVGDNVQIDFGTTGTRAISATTLAATTTGVGASLIGIEDVAGNITATTVEGALAELATTAGGGIQASLFDANTILKADVDNTPIAMTVGANQVVGRAGGSISAITINTNELLGRGSSTMGGISVAANSYVGRTGTGDLGSVAVAAQQMAYHNATDFGPKTVAANSFVGRTGAGNLGDVTVGNNTFLGNDTTGMAAISAGASTFVGRTAASNLKAMSVSEVKDVLNYQANEIDYSNATSGMVATNVQTAIDELEARVDTLEGVGFGQWAIKTSASTLADGDKILADTTAGVFTLTLPLSPSLGDEVRIRDGARNTNTNNLTIARNGQPIAGIAADLVVGIDGADIHLVYMDVTNGWTLASA